MSTAGRYAQRFGIERLSLSAALIGVLQASDWPGNVRELENAIARMVALSGGGELAPDALAVAASTPAAEPGAEAPRRGALSLRDQLDAMERSLIAQSLDQTGGNQSEAARRLGMSRSALIVRLQKYGL